MTPLVALWLPILVAAVLAFFASSLIWMVLPHHKTDFAAIPDEDEVIEALRKRDVSQGAYHFPYCQNAGKPTPEEMEKIERGPAGLVWIGPAGKPNMGKMMGCWFVFLLAVEAVVAYLAGISLGPGAEPLTVFRVTGTAALLGFAAGPSVYAIWFFQPWSNAMKSTFDGVVYALLSAAAFAWLWPAG